MIQYDGLLHCCYTDDHLYSKLTVSHKNDSTLKDILVGKTCRALFGIYTEYEIFHTYQSPHCIQQSSTVQYIVNGLFLMANTAALVCYSLLPLN